MIPTKHPLLLGGFVVFVSGMLVLPTRAEELSGETSDVQEWVRNSCLLITSGCFQFLRLGDEPNVQEFR